MYSEKPYLLRNIPLAPYTTMKVGGAAAYLGVVRCIDDLAWYCRWAKQACLPLYGLGGGSNVVIGDEGLPGVVLLLRFRGIHIQHKKRRLEVAAGESWSTVVQAACALGWEGIECLAGIPGTAGAAPVQNIGAYGQQLSDVLVNVVTYDTQTERTECWPAKALRLGYRQSIFKTEWHHKIITQVVLQFHSQTQVEVVQQKARATLEQRRQKGMLVEQQSSCGSFFVNPILTPSMLKNLQTCLPEVPSYMLADGHVKVPAAYLIEQAGFNKGYVYGRVGLSPYHTLAIINRGQGTACEIMQLAQRIHNKVVSGYGIALQREVVFWGESLRNSHSRIMQIP
jgi:UDP-N-acetylmuramate dehydrogenase